MGRRLGEYLSAAACLAACLASPASGQQDGGRSLYEEQLRVRMDRQRPSAREVDLGLGGWLSASFFNFDDDAARRERVLRQLEIHPWARLRFQRVHNFYVRGLVGWDDWNSGDNPTPGRGDQDTDATLERAWYELDLAEAYRNRTGQEPGTWLKFKVGRDFAQIGTALVLSTPLDMVRVVAATGDWQGMAFLGKTRRHSRNIDDSSAVANRQERCLWGAQLTYTGATSHRPFVYYMGNKDNTDPVVRDPNQSYVYDSQYVGLGSHGTLWQDLRYRAELVGEWGNTYSDGAVSGRDRTCATGADLMVEYLMRAPTRPKFMFEYLFGSGDEDHRDSATTTVGGNRRGTSNRAFNAFGFRDTGVAFAPRMANLHINAAGASFFPLESIRRFRRFEVGTKVFCYNKVVSAGAISDPVATRSSHWVGWEPDLYCNWRLTSDLSWTVRYGAFFPGSAFSEGSCRQYLFTGIIFSF